MAELFGFKIERLKGPSTDPRQNIVPPQAEDGTQTVPAGGFFASYGGFDVAARNELDLIRRYREMALHPEADGAIEDVVNEAIVSDLYDTPIQIELSNLKGSRFSIFSALKSFKILQSKQINVKTGLLRKITLFG